MNSDLKTQSLGISSGTLRIICLLLIVFAAGWLAGARVAVRPRADTQRDYLANRGDAPAAIRSGVLASLQVFQDGYRARDPKQIDPFMRALFPKDEPVLLTGTDATEWREGYSSVRQFIATDWQSWGSVDLDVSDSVISSSGDVAWLATVGSVGMTHSTRPIRFTAVLIRRNERWFFRQVQFQWDERPAYPSDFLSSGAASNIAIR